MDSFNIVSKDFKLAIFIQPLLIIGVIAIIYVLRHVVERQIIGLCDCIREACIVCSEFLRRLLQFIINLCLYFRPYIMGMNVPMPILLYLVLLLGLHSNIVYTILFHIFICFLVSFVYFYSAYGPDRCYGPIVDVIGRPQVEQTLQGVDDSTITLVVSLVCLYCNLRDSAKAPATTWLRHIACFLNTYYSPQEMVGVFKTIFGVFDDEIEPQTIEAFFLDNDTLEPQSFSFESCGDFLKTWRDLNESELMQRATRVVHSCMYSAFLKSMDIDLTTSRLMHFLPPRGAYKPFSTPQEFLLNLCELVVNFLKSGYECLVENSIQPLLIANRSTREWIQDVDSVMEKALQEPLTDNFDNVTVVEEMDKLISRGQTMKVDSRCIGPIMIRLVSTRTRIVQKYGVSAVRKAPFSILVHGSPGQGKTFVTHLLARIYQQAVVTAGIHPDLKWDPKRNSYTLNSNDEYMSGYRGATQWCIFLDDLAREPASHVSKGLSTYSDTIITMINDVGVASNQASLEDKGVIPIIPKLCVGTTNTKKLHSHLSAACPAALLRRFPYVIEPILKKEYLDEATGTMRKMTTIVHDAWDYKIETVKLSNIGGETLVEHVPFKAGDNISSSSELSAFLVDKIIKHERSANAMMDGLTSSDQPTMCIHNVLSLFPCFKCDLVSQEKCESEDIKDMMDEVDSILNEASDDDFKSVSSVLEPQAGPIGTLIGKLVRRRDMTVSDQLQAGMLVALYVTGSMDTFYASVALMFKQYSFRRASTIYHCALQEAYLAKVPSHIRKIITVIDYSTTAAFLGLAISGVYSKMYPSDSYESQGNNIWANTDGFNDYFSVPSVAKRGNRDEVIASVKKSMIKVVVKDGSSTNSAFAFHLDGSLFVTVGHIFRPDSPKWECQAHLTTSAGITKPVQSFVLTPDCVTFMANDIAVFDAALLPRGSLRKFLPPGEIDKASRKGLLINPMLVTPGIVDMCSYSTTTYKSDFGNAIRGDFMTGVRSDAKPVRGDCGSLIVSQIGEKWVITGMHCAGSPPHVKHTTIVTTQLCQDNFRSFKPLVAMSDPGDTKQFSIGVPRSGPLGKPYRKGVHCWTPAKCEVLGSFPNGVTTTSSVEPTAIHDRVVDICGVSPAVGVPLMKAVQREDGTWINPFTIATEQQGAVSGLFPITDVIKCVNSFYEDVTRDGTDWLKDVRNLTTMEGINGIVENQHINRIVMKTSGGFNFPGKKSKYFTLRDDELWYPSDEVSDAISELECTYSLGERARPIFNATLKDEPLSKKKIAAGKTRVFTASPVHVTIVERKQYMGICAAIEDNNILTECAVAMNHLVSWDLIYKHITTFGEDRVIAGDYGNYDKGMPPIFILGSFMLLDRLRSVHVPLSRRDQLISQGLATDIAFPVVNMNKELIQFYGGNPSGHPLTSVVNSLANSLFMRFCYFKCGFALETFTFNVKLITYGDDNAMGSRVDGFNHTSIQRVLAEHGVKFTMSDKEAESKPFCHISEIDFLKRKFSKIGDKIVAPLDEKSIFKSLCYWVRKDTIESPQQLAQSYGAARREWCLHGEEVFNHRVSQMEKVLDCSIGEKIKRHFTRQHTMDFDTTWDFLFGDPERYSWDEFDSYSTLEELVSLSHLCEPSQAIWEE